MYSVLYLGGLAFAICFLLTPLVRNLTYRLGILDHPDRQRKFHAEPIPRLGGVAIAFAVASSLAIISFIPSWGSRAFSTALEHILPLLPAAALVFVVGLLDDLFELRPWQKLLGQFAAATWIYLAGIQIGQVAGISFNGSHWIAFPLTIVWLLACTNAFNLIDGMDGLASGVGFFATLTILVSAVLGDDAPLMVLTAPLAGALLAFLRFNFNPASIFLGDSGSLLIGFLLGSYAIIWSQKAATILGMTAPLLALGFPIAEAVISLTRRWLRGAPVFGPDRAHIHHRLLERGLKPRQVALLIYAITGFSAAVSLMISVPHVRERGFVLLLFCVVAWMGFQHLGYTEFGAARRILLGGTVAKLVAADVRLRGYRKQLEKAESLHECWNLTAETLRDLGFDHLEMDLPGRSNSPRLHWTKLLHPERGEISPQDCCTLRIHPASEADGVITLTHRLDHGDGYLVVHPIAEAIRNCFPRHITGYRQQGVAALEIGSKPARAATQVSGA